ncbi:MAG: radical SAM protein [Methanomicrobium sp.]|nr:radical SAM protein [Methanomicrobium sp.]
MNNSKNNKSYRQIFDGVIEAAIKNAQKIASKNPGLILTGAKIAYHQKRAAGIRDEYEKKGIIVPGVMMMALTSRCNLTCKGCYMKTRECSQKRPDMTDDEIICIISQAKKIGVSAVVFAGGEPLLKLPLILKLADMNPEMLFLVFTNGLLIDERAAKILGKCKNIVPMLSFEGFLDETDIRRRQGIYNQLLNAAKSLFKKGMFFGCSIMVTAENILSVTDEKFVSEMASGGVLAFVYIEYVPLEKGTENLVLSKENQAYLKQKINEFSERFPALFIGFPGDEESFGGCLAAGRGFVHVSPDGSLEACPAAPFSDTNLKDVSLTEALGSELLQKIRENHGLLTESEGGCALFGKHGFVRELTE